MKKLLIAGSAAMLSMSAFMTTAQAEVKVGVILGFTGPIESLTPDMANSAELAFKEASDSGALLGGETITSVRADSTCTDSAAATAGAERLITSDGVVAIMGADCSGVTTAILTSVAVANGVAMISPSATSPALSTVEDKGLFFRTSPSDARQGQVMADILSDMGVKTVAITYTNNDYGKGLSDAFTAAHEAAGGKIAIAVPHEDGKADYSAEVGTLSAVDADMLAVLGYVDQGGAGIIQAAIDADAYDKFLLGDGMIGDSLVEKFGEDLSGAIGTVPGSEGAGADAFLATAKAGGVDGDGPFRGESYDAAALIVLAMQAAGSADKAGIAANIMAVANAPGEKIMAGELGKALKILADGGEVDYQGATGVELIGPGEAAGSYKELSFAGGEQKTVRIR
ncbi:MAG: ABC transporter substrate-binding protein [Granulosicoccaceae bacterium]